MIIQPRKLIAEFVVKTIIVGLLTGILGLLASLVPVGLHLEETIGLDLLFKLRGTRKAPTDVVVVSMGKGSADALNLPKEPYKWPRSLHARLVEKLSEEGAAVIVFDLSFTESHSDVEDKQFADSISNAANVVLLELIEKKIISLNDDERQVLHANIEKLVPPIPPLARSALALAPFPLPKVPVKLTQYWTFKTSAGEKSTLPIVVFQTFALDVYDQFIRLLEKLSPMHARQIPYDKNSIIAGKNIEKLTQILRDMFKEQPGLAEKLLVELHNSKPLPAEKKMQTLTSLVKMYQSADSRYLNFYGPPGTIPTVHYYQVLQNEEKSIVDQQQIDFAGKVVFIGLSELVETEQDDGFYTVFSQPNGIDLSGVEIAATAFANLVDDTPVQPIGLKSHILLVFFWGILLGIVCRISSIKFGALNAIGLSVLYLFGTVYIFKTKDIWYPVVIPLFFQTPMAFMGAVGIEHFRLFKEVLSKLRMERDLSVARDVQMSMLPSSCPEVSGYQIAVSSTPAREVSGDFFDFIDIDADKMGFVIADVTGKSVSGALVMTASKSVFRLLSEDQLTVAEIMKRANLQIKKDITRAKGMFVALLYAVLNKEDRSLSLCSAGQTQPILLSAKTGEATLIETEGDAFPLGIIDDADYQETQLQLDSGDLIVFYTDGVVEAMNKKEKMYGFERFIEVIKKNKGLDANAFLEKLIDDINNFVGKAEQHDDLTIVLIKVD